MLVHRRVTSSIKFAGTHLYTWVEKGTMRVKCLAQEHNTMSRPWLEPGPLAPESSALTMRPPCLPKHFLRLSLYYEIFVKPKWVKRTLPLTKALLIASINLSSSMETRFFACSGVVDHTNELKFSVNLTQIKRKNLVN